MSAGAGNGSLIVVGAINVDLVVASQRLPAPGETVVGSSLERHGGGKGANAAVAAARAGADVRVVCAVGKDSMADEALADLRDAGVNLAGVAELDKLPTGAALIVVDAAGENQIAVAAGANSGLSADWVERRVSENAEVADCVLVSTEIPEPAVAAAVVAATRAGVTCILNSAPPVPVVVDLLEHGPILTPNARELSQLVELLGLDPSRGPALSGAALAARTGSPVVVTLGGDGALVVATDGETELFRPPVVAVRDTTGAGDTFNGVLAAELAGRRTLSQAVRVAVLAAALSVSHAGARTGMPTREQIDAALRVARPKDAGPAYGSGV